MLCLVRINEEIIRKGTLAILCSSSWVVGIWPCCCLLGHVTGKLRDTAMPGWQRRRGFPGVKPDSPPHRLANCRNAVFQNAFSSYSSPDCSAGSRQAWMSACKLLLSLILCRTKALPVEQWLICPLQNFSLVLNFEASTAIPFSSLFLVQTVLSWFSPFCHAIFRPCPLVCHPFWWLLLTDRV